MPRYVEDLDWEDRDEWDCPPSTFTCRACGDTVDVTEATVMERDPEMPTFCINCACRD